MPCIAAFLHCPDFLALISHSLPNGCAADSHAECWTPADIAASKYTHSNPVFGHHPVHPCACTQLPQQQQLLLLLLLSPC
jgi:hypothetical protein